MGRKIPAKKHRGVKDPLEQQARRMQCLKGKINAPPKDPDEQPVPRSLTRLFAFHDRDKTIRKKKKKIKPVCSVHDNTVNNAGVGDNPIAKLKKLPGESGRSFSLRINSAIRTLHTPLEQDDYPEDMEVADEKGERMAAQRQRRQRKHQRALARAPPPPPAPPGPPAAPPRQGGGGDAPADKPTRSQKRALKKKTKIETAKAAAQAERPEVVYERVQFGDVAHAPPPLTARPRHAPAARPGRRDLLLTAMLSGGGAGAPGRAAPPVPPAELARRERVRLDVVAAYRAHKKQARLAHTREPS